ncbi:cytochrome bd oxidase small subunit CydS [Bacillus solimangrovi]
MQHFLIMYAPLLVVGLSIAGLFIWGMKGRFLENIE